MLLLSFVAIEIMHRRCRKTAGSSRATKAAV
jgi:hypothetical protein